MREVEACPPHYLKYAKAIKALANPHSTETDFHASHALQLYDAAQEKGRLVGGLLGFIEGIF